MGRPLGTKGTRPLAFSICSAVIGDARRPVARYWCAECGTTLDIPQKSGGKIVPELIAETARTVHGWQASANTGAPTRCAKCIAAAKDRPPNDVDSELRRFRMRAMSTTTVATPTPKPDVDDKTVAIRETRPDQRIAIRNLLDRHFDGDVGCYLADWSDQKIAETVKVARQVVEKARDFAYGPIRVSPAEAAARMDIAALRKELSEDKAAFDTLIEERRKDHARAMAKLDELEKRLTGRAAA